MIDVLGGKSQFKWVIHSQGVGYKDQTTAMYAITQRPSFGINEPESYDEELLKQIAMWLWKNQEINELRAKYSKLSRILKECDHNSGIGIARLDNATINKAFIGDFVVKV